MLLRIDSLALASHLWVLDILATGIKSNALFRACAQNRAENAKYLWGLGCFTAADRDADGKGYFDCASGSRNDLQVWLMERGCQALKNPNTKSLREQDPGNHRRTIEQRRKDGVPLAPSRKKQSEKFYNEGKGSKQWREQVRTYRNSSAAPSRVPEWESSQTWGLVMDDVVDDRSKRSPRQRTYSPGRPKDASGYGKRARHDE